MEQRFKDRVFLRLEKIETSLSPVLNVSNLFGLPSEQEVIIYFQETSVSLRTHREMWSSRYFRRGRKEG
jgi:hypothetical protein